MMHILTPSIDCPQSISVCFPTRVVPGSRAQSLGVIEPKLPLIRRIERKPAPQKGTRLLQNSSPLSPTLAQAL